MGKEGTGVVFAIFLRFVVKLGKLLLRILEKETRRERRLRFWILRVESLRPVLPRVSLVVSRRVWWLFVPRKLCHRLVVPVMFVYRNA